MKILFVCMYNRFRSKVAEAIFKNLNKNENIHSESAGIKIDKLRPYVEPVVLDYVNKKGYPMKSSLPTRVTEKFLKEGKFDLIIISAENVDIGYFKRLNLNAKIIKWKIKDCPSIKFECIQNSINEIEGNVKKLIKEIERFK